MGRARGRLACTPVGRTGKPERQRDRLSFGRNYDGLGQARGRAGAGAELGGGSSAAEAVPERTREAEGCPQHGRQPGQHALAKGGSRHFTEPPAMRLTVGIAAPPPSRPPFLLPPSFLPPSSLLPSSFLPLFFLPPSLSPSFLSSFHEPNKYLLSICHLPDITHYLFTI